MALRRNDEGTKEARFKYWRVAKGWPTPAEKKDYAWYVAGYMSGVIKVNVDEADKDETPCWVAFPTETEKQRDAANIPVTYKEAEAGVWILRGWDVGFLPRGTAHPEECKWLT